MCKQVQKMVENKHICVPAAAMQIVQHPQVSTTHRTYRLPIVQYSTNQQIRKTRLPQRPKHLLSNLEQISVVIFLTKIESGKRHAKYFTTQKHSNSKIKLLLIQVLWYQFNFNRCDSYEICSRKRQHITFTAYRKRKLYLH